MKLTEKEREILACAELRADAPIAKIRKETGYREHTIRYHLKNLVERGIIGPIPFINLHALGYMIFNIFFSVGSEKKTTKEALLTSFKASRQVVWIGEFGGEYQYGIAITVKHIGPVLDFLNSVSKRFQKVFFEKAISCQFSATVFYRKYISSKHFNVPPLTCGVVRSAVEIDELDDRILVALASYGGLSHRRLAQEIQIPLSTLELRLRKLEEKNVIAGHIYAVDPAKFGMQCFKLLIFGKGINPDLSAAILKFAQEHPHINYLIECFGNWDYELGVEVERAESVNDVIQEIYERFGNNINTVKLLSKFRDIKFRWYPG